MKTEIWLVTASHTHVEYRFDDTPTKVHQDSNGFFAVHPKLGCGKTYATPRGAIRGLFSDHACTVIAADKVP